MSVSDDLKFTFDVQGYLHLRGALTPEELAEYRSWIEQTKDADVQALNADNPDALRYHLNRPVSRVIDADPRFARFLDHPAAEPFLREFLGPGYRHIDNDLYFTHPGYAGGGWHRGVPAHPTGYVIDGGFTCPMVKVFYCMTDVGPGEGEFVVVPGSHKAQFAIDMKRVDLPGQHVFDDVRAGDLIIFNEALLHNGRPNPSTKTRQTIIVNFGRENARVWEGYQPRSETYQRVTARQREILTNSESGTWNESPAV
jgi:hypothetical protein